MPESLFVQSSARPLDCRHYMPLGAAGEEAASNGLSKLALQLVGSEILKIAASVRALQAKGHAVTNQLDRQGTFCQNNFQFRQAAKRRHPKRMSCARPTTTVGRYAGDAGNRDGSCIGGRSGLIIRSKRPRSSGARPAIYGTYRAIIDPGGA